MLKSNKWKPYQIQHYTLSLGFGQTVPFSHTATAIVFWREEMQCVLTLSAMPPYTATVRYHGRWRNAPRGTPPHQSNLQATHKLLGSLSHHQGAWCDNPTTQEHTRRNDYYAVSTTRRYLFRLS